jgi:hypothetical protein
MASSTSGHVTGFAGARLIARGPLAAVARAAHARRKHAPLILDDTTGRAVEIDLRGSVDDVLARLVPPPIAQTPTRGRPKLGVTAREVTLLPRHWDWLATQPGGASAALRRLVDQARRETGDADAIRQAQDVAYRVMTTLAGDLPDYEEAARALFARDRARFEGLIVAWPKDVAAYVGELSERVWPPS